MTREQQESDPFDNSASPATPARLASVEREALADRSPKAEQDRVLTNAEARSWIVASAGFLALIAASGFSAALYGRPAFGSPDSICEFLGVGMTAGLLDWGASNVLGADNPRAISKLEKRVRLALSSWAAACAMLLLMIFVLKVSDHFSRATMLTFFVTGLLAVTAVRGVLAPALVRATRRAALRRRGALVIADACNPALLAVVRALRDVGYDSPIAVTIDVSRSQEHWPEQRRRVLDHIAFCAKTMKAGEIFLCGSGIPIDRLKSLETGLSLIPRSLFYVPDDAVSRVLRGRQISELGEHVTVEIQREPLSRFERAVKRMIDLAGATVLLIALLPVLAIVAIAIGVDSPGPILFRQTRLGLGGRPFDILKFRTMHVTENGSHVRQARRNDARVTKVGRVLRRTSLDELPQLINVIKGEMSLVGPRPHAIAHDEEFAKIIENYEIRQHVKPGVTGWAQVTGLRGETPSPDVMAKRIDADLWYAANASIWLDVRIILRTAMIILTERDAY
ncbi:exopolysaccharide biosynthesis polyprenyl glycosylphosphotransferase [Methylosinus sp. Sm6]|uniref:exopolysaccharide biosynthesis polyprenyl glycosylphosphotransferase n=1 Tax=Methylosinus sp. Sm6 TaxID=2866948 RepID=UPI001C996FA7|nr:exopolysaccharide biosynthesis polyprenyl glycosylphosphotransferase [Methylosinus sp. Sm6]MBY6243394.1 exopolysaccharide biosynthesis polyprenyl glycosylphosphotransferase [Methylosinus sp. Sm6]